MTTNILIVEDNPIDFALLRAAFRRELSWETRLTLARDGEEAIQYLLSSWQQVDLVILDLHLPRRDGLDVLRAIRTECPNRQLPVIIFSSSPEDARTLNGINEQLNANGYFEKPADVHSYSTITKRFRSCYESVSQQSLARSKPVAHEDHNLA